MTLRVRPGGPLAGAALAGVVLAVSACGSGSVQVRVPEPEPPAAEACRRLHDRLPSALDGQPGRAAEPSSRLVAAWGSPPIVLRCGVNEPDNLRPASKLVAVNGVEWFPETDRSPLRFTTVDRVADIQLLLPREYGVPADALAQLAGPIKQTVPAAGP